eukprot:jgi/Mesvir1/23610/Mv18292-RA.1
MVKTRMTAADIAAEVACLQSMQKLIGMRVANIYDINAKTYLLKLSRSSGEAQGGESEKVLLLLEAGTRFHTTQFLRDKGAMPSGITLKMRKHIRTKRLESVQQLGIDRVVDFQFGVGESCCHLLLELYAQGNLLLTDASYQVLTLLRSHRDDDKGVAMLPRHLYPIHTIRPPQATTRAALLEGMAAAVVAAPVEAKGKGGSNSDTQLKAVLGNVLPYGPNIVEHILRSSGLPGSLALRDGTASLSEAQLDSLYNGISSFEKWMSGLKTPCVGTPVPGYIYQKRVDTRKDAAPKDATASKGADAVSSAGAGGTPGADASSLIYDEFSPLRRVGAEGERGTDPSGLEVAFTSFDEALDDFFSKIEGQRAEMERAQQQAAALSKVDKIRADQGSRAEALQREAEQRQLKAELIEYNLEEVDAAINAVREALATGMDWDDLARMIKAERKAGNPVAGLIQRLDLAQNKMTLLLANNLDEASEEQRTCPVEPVEVDLSLSAHANASIHYTAKKRQQVKHQKTVDAGDKVLRDAEKKALAQVAKAKGAGGISAMRRTLWFEKFHWFVSSENYLVLCGRDAQQNEMLVKKYMGKGDVYVHADLHGASTCIVKNRQPDKPVPPLTLQQAGTATVCRSAGWDSKIVTSAWWVYPDQVSKTAPTGEYLTTGSFMVRGKKNFLPPSQLVLGFGFMFLLHESSIAGHLNERRVKGSAAEDEDADEAPGVGHPRDGRSMQESGAGSSGWAGAQAVMGDGGKAPRQRGRFINGLHERAEPGEAEAPGEEGAGVSDGGSDSGEEGDAVGEEREVAGGLRNAAEPEPVADELAAFLDSAPVAVRSGAAAGAGAGAGARGSGSSGHGTAGAAGGRGTSAFGALDAETDEDASNEHERAQGGGDGAGASSGARRGRSGAAMSAKERRQLRKERRKHGSGTAAGESGRGGSGGEGGGENGSPGESASARVRPKPGGSSSDEDDGEGASEERPATAGPAVADAGGGGANRGKGASGMASRPQTAWGAATGVDVEIKRGKRGKLKKIKGKYADQDEEDRAIALALLQSAGPRGEEGGEGDGKGGKGSGKGAKGGKGGAAARPGPARGKRRMWRSPVLRHKGRTCWLRRPLRRLLPKTPTSSATAATRRAIWRATALPSLAAPPWPVALPPLPRRYRTWRSKRTTWRWLSRRWVWPAGHPMQKMMMTRERARRGRGPMVLVAPLGRHRGKPRKGGLA